MSATASLRTRTDRQGRFQFNAVSEDRATLLVSKSGYVDTYYGQGRSSGPFGFLTLRPGEMIGSVNLLLRRGNVITGRIVNRYGTPIVGAVVTAVHADDEEGQRDKLFTAQQNSAPMHRLENPHVLTDIDGRYRIATLADGEYHLIVAPGDAPEGHFSTHLPVYYPGTLNQDDARAIHLAGQSTFEASIRIGKDNLFRVTGSVTTSKSLPLKRGMMKAVQRSRKGGPITAATTIGRITDGRFDLELPPGAYSLVAISETAWNSGNVQRSVETGAIPVIVQNSGISGLTIRTSAGATVSGRIVTFNGSVPPDAHKLRVAVIPHDGTRHVLGSAPAQADGTFELKNVFSPGVLNVGGSHHDLWVSGTFWGNHDVSDVGLSATGGHLKGVKVVLGNPVAEIVGVVRDISGRPVVNAVVLCAALDDSKWQHPLNRYVTVTRSVHEGLFSMRGLPGGEYFVVAVRDMDLRWLNSGEMLRRLRTLGAKFRIDGNSRHVMRPLDVQEAQFDAASRNSN